jgi:hypothetical protein
MYVLPTSTTEALLEYTFRDLSQKKNTNRRKNTFENSAFTEIIEKNKAVFL